ncbi:MAG: hypothetical protein ACYDH5_09370 [Acidimicrobiales bacterium]
MHGQLKLLDETDIETVGPSTAPSAVASGIGRALAADGRAGLPPRKRRPWPEAADQADWKLDERTRRAGRLGLAMARATLDRARASSAA